ncbi:MAG: cystatin domain-containing protein [Acidobacteriota bacterium]|nr:cystatin domain-containing protein [Acidobacteriota bacterium]
MKKITGKILAFIGLYLLTSGLFSLSAHQIVGNYRKISKLDDEVVAAARFAVRQEKRKKSNRGLSLVSIESAASQVVAGRNYKICMKVKINGKTQSATAVVFRNLKDKFSLTSWNKGICETD